MAGARSESEKVVSCSVETVGHVRLQSTTFATGNLGPRCEAPLCTGYRDSIACGKYKYSVDIQEARHVQSTKRRTAGLSDCSLTVDCSDPVCNERRWS
eukprot:6909575-Pyramimonas_sp.AAC.2